MIYVLVIASLLVANSGRILSAEKLPSFLLTISPVLSFAPDTTSGSPPISFKISTVNQVLRLFL